MGSKEGTQWRQVVGSAGPFVHSGCQPNSYLLSASFVADAVLGAGDTPAGGGGVGCPCCPEVYTSIRKDKPRASW